MPTLGPLQGAASAVGGRVSRARGRSKAPDRWAHTPTESLTVSADDGVALYVEIDDPKQGSRTRKASGTSTPTVVLVHGFTLSMRSWVIQRRTLIHSGYRVVAYDQRSHGRSGESSLEHCTIDQLGRDLQAVIERTCPAGPIVLIGHSMGGMSVMSWAGAHPNLVRDRVLAVGLIATSAGGDEMTEFGLGRGFGRLVGSVGESVLTRLGRHAVAIRQLRRMGKGVQDVVIRRWSFGSPVGSYLVDFVAEQIFSTPFEVMAAFLPDLDGLDITEGLSALVGIEVLVLNGAGDLLTPPSHSVEIVRRIPGAEHVVVEDAGHIIMVEHPELVNQQLLMLIQRAQRAVDEGVAVSSKPRVLRTIQDFSRKREQTRGGARRGKVS